MDGSFRGPKVFEVENEYFVVYYGEASGCWRPEKCLSYVDYFHVYQWRRSLTDEGQGELTFLSGFERKLSSCCP